MSVPRFGAALAGVAGAALIAVGFLPWFEAGGGSTDLWESFGALDVIAACAGLLALAAGATALRGEASGLAVAASSIAAGAGAVTLILLAYRLIDPPGGDAVEREAGAWLGTLAAAGITLGGYLGIQEG